MGYNMNGFSGFGNSPAKQVSKALSNIKSDGGVGIVKKKKSRQDSINTYDAKVEALEEDRFNEKITQKQYDAAVSALETTRVKGGKKGEAKDTNRPR
tara:strand:+ start:485 stop:775 length:291 start_codon:yes stop_codon:yes gene_type:complete